MGDVHAFDSELLGDVCHEVFKALFTNTEEEWMKDLHPTNAGLNEWCGLVAKNTATSDIERLLLASTRLLHHALIQQNVERRRRQQF